MFLKSVFIFFALPFALGAVSLPRSANAQEFGYAPVSEDTYRVYVVGLIHDLKMQEEVEVTQEQMRTLRKLFREKVAAKQAKVEAEKQKYGDGDSKEKLIVFRDNLEMEMYRSLADDITEVLMPFQKERLDQLAFSRALQRGGGMVVLLQSKFVHRMLEIDEEQASNLTQEIRDIQKEMAEELKELKAKYREKVVDLLKPKQREKLNEMLGIENDK